MAGGLSKLKISFKKVQDKTLGELFGTKPIPATELMKVLWVLIKKKGLRADKE